MWQASGNSPEGADDNCHFEFAYACRRKGVAGMVPVVMEAGCRDTNGWTGVVGGKLGGRRFVDLAGPKLVYNSRYNKASTVRTIYYVVQQ